MLLCLYRASTQLSCLLWCLNIKMSLRSTRCCRKWKEAGDAFTKPGRGKLLKHCITEALRLTSLQHVEDLRYTVADWDGIFYQVLCSKKVSHPDPLHTSFCEAILGRLHMLNSFLISFYCERDNRRVSRAEKKGPYFASVCSRDLWQKSPLWYLLFLQT